MHELTAEEERLMEIGRRSLLASRLAEVLKARFETLLNDELALLLAREAVNFLEGKREADGR